MDFDIVNMPAMTVIGAELRTTFKNNECYSAIPRFLENVRQEDLISKIPNKIDPNIVLSMYTNYTSDFSLTSGSYSLIFGAPVMSVEKVPQEMVIKEIPAAKYAVFIAKGPFATAIGKKWMEIWQNKELQRTFTNDFEWYDSLSTNDENSIVKIYIAIK